jgi:hypothetical protein
MNIALHCSLLNFEHCQFFYRLYEMKQILVWMTEARIKRSIEVL